MKTKRTCNISVEAVATVKRLDEERHIAPSQVAFVEQAIIEMARQVRDADDARSWESAPTDPAFQAEAQQLDAEFANDAHEAWEL